MKIVLKNQRGFTLIEILIALVIFAVGILGAAMMQISSISENSHASRISTATNAGASELESLMGLSFDDTVLVDNSNTGVNAGVTGLDNTDETGHLADGGPMIKGNDTLFWNVAMDYPIVGVKTIRVIVQRSDKGKVKKIPLDFIRMEPI